MFKYSTLGVFFFLFFTTSASASKPFFSHNTEKQIFIDGKDNDWDDSLIYYVEELGGVAGIVNDDSFLTIMFRFGDPELRRKITIGGATLWWHPEGKKKKAFAIRFPSTFKPGSFREMAEQSGNLEQNMEMDTRSLELISPIFWDKKADKKYSWSQIDGIAASAGMEKGLLCYEFKIPLNRNNPYALNIKPGKKFNLCLELGGLENKKELQKQMKTNKRPGNMGDNGRRGGMGGRGGGMGGGGLGGMRPGGGRMGDRQNMKDLFDAENIWLFLKIND